MLYLAHVKNKARFPDESELVAKSQPAFVRQYLGLKWPEPHLYYAMFNTEMGEACTTTILVECVQQFECDAE